MCVFISCVCEYKLESTTENITDVYENRALGYMGKSPNLVCLYPLESGSEQKKI